MKYYIDKPTTQRIQGGGKFSEEWFDIKLEVNYETVMELADTTVESNAKVSSFAFKQLAAWSLTDSNGNPLPLDKATFDKLPFELVQPLFAYLNDPDFLAQALPQAKAEKS